MHAVINFKLVCNTFNCWAVTHDRKRPDKKTLKGRTDALALKSYCKKSTSLACYTVTYVTESNLKLFLHSNFEQLGLFQLCVFQNKALLNPCVTCIMLSKCFSKLYIPSNTKITEPLPLKETLKFKGNVNLLNLLLSIYSQNKEIFRDRYRKAREENAWSYNTHSNVYGFMCANKIEM